MGRKTSVQLYKLAIELNLATQDLVDACSRAGIHGKGFPFASLTDDELVKLKAFLEKEKPANKVVAYYTHLYAAAERSESNRRKPVLRLPRLPPPT